MKVNTWPVRVSARLLNNQVVFLASLFVTITVGGKGLAMNQHENSVALVHNATPVTGVEALGQAVVADKPTLDGLDLNAERMAALVEIMPAAMFMCDREGLILYYNQRAAELWGRRPRLRDPVDRYCGSFRVFRPDGSLLPHEECPMAVAVRTGRVARNQEIHIERPDGTIILASVNIDPLYDHAGRLIGAINVFEDITQRKQAEERLQTIYDLSIAVNRSEAIEKLCAQALAALERILKVDRVALLLLDGEGVMRFQAWRGLSTAYRRQVEGYSPWSSDDRQLQPVLIPDAAQADLGPRHQVILDEGIHALAFIPIAEGGRLLGAFTLYYNRPHLFPKADVQWAHNIARKIAYALRRRQAEEALRQINETLEQRVQERTAELERSNRELDQFAYVASHDLKAPLRAISHLANWIAEDAAGQLTPSSQEHLAKLLARVRRMEVLLDDLLTYSRAGRQRHPTEPVDLVALIQNVVELLALPPGFQVHIPATAPSLTTERIPLETILRNLIGNAIKHHTSPAEGWVEITVEEQGDFVLFAVRDNGPGIDPAFHGRIFQMFQTLHPRDQIEGSGVGLAVVQKLVESRGGSVAVESCEGVGATFRFTWPKAATP
jgi:signal transduction histidine kinase/PAS domain-containing protein